MTVEIGAAPLSPEEVFEIMHLGARIRLDNSYIQREVSEFDESQFVFAESEGRSFSFLCLILELANSESVITVSGLELLISRFEGNYELVESKLFTIPQFEALRLASIMRFVDKLLPVAFALHAELSSAQLGFLSAISGRAGRSIADEVKTFIANSKRAAEKKTGDPTPFAALQSFREAVQAFSPIAREELHLTIKHLAPPKCNWLSESAQEAQELCANIFEKQTAFINSLVVENGIWKFTESDNQGIFPETMEALAAELCFQIHKSLEVLRETRREMKKGSLPIGMGSLQLLEAAEAHWANLDGGIASTFEFLLSAVKEILQSSTTHRVPLPPPGTRDLTPIETLVRTRALKRIRDVFEAHSAVEVETPTFESRVVLLGKYGEDEKLIYNIEDFGEDPLSLRYDLTVPFARYCATNGVREMKRYQIGRVYRRDKPVMERGRFREFYQCDFDIAGEFSRMTADAEVLCVAHDILKQLDLSFKVLVNDRRLLDAAMAYAGVPSEKFRGVCGCVDALDKISEQECREKLINEKGLNDQVCDTIFKLISWNCDGPEFPTLAQRIKECEPEFAEAAADPIADIQVMLEKLQKMSPDACKLVKVDFSLARGLDYYTGMVFEAKLDGQESSIAGGGRYDGLLGQTGGQHVPAVGGSIGIERIFALLENKSTEEKQLDCYVVACPGGSLNDRLEIAGKLWERGVKVGVSLKDSQSLKSLKRDLEDAVLSGCAFCLIRGGDEIENGVIGIKNLTTQEEINVPIAEFIDHVMQRLGASNESFEWEYFKKMLEDVKDGVRSLEDVLSKLK